ncbi:Trypsin-like peptidase domain-containing protein [Cribrihabitans marinus]|uniref:Trypsin-like peptidase domain-containing protein n=1 Tax=Cribrihabitans marinus TaxID=1227549 RepID=A0A1H6U531_9RHOB|nr:serine protease [Cribrihabitans marinus]GGH21330.1 hypothetical protein GCM10010973_05860 [Cribrihabitans marinus]SEI83480.1 Trypsin-like peptidase domain-containing protein [Cribrihabitans marinus]
MAEQFLSKIRVDQQDFVEAGGRAVLERHDELRAMLSDRAGPETAALFAEPLISRGNDTAPPSIAWYADGSEAPRPFSALSGAERDRAEAWLRDHLRPLRALAEDPETADLAWGLLSTYGQDDVMMLGERPVVVNWGLLPGGRGASVASRPAHFEAGLGRFLEPPARVRPQAAPHVTPASATAVTPLAEPRRLRPVAWVPLILLLLLCGGVLLWLLQPGTRLFPPDAPKLSEADLLQAQIARNASLRDRAEALEADLAGAVCRADGVLILPGGLTPDGLTPPPEGTGFPARAAAAPNAVLPTQAGRVLVPDPDAPDSPQSLLEHIAARTVLILAGNGSGGFAGSGLVVGPGLVVTNQHVVSEARDGPILVAGGALGAPVEATVLKVQGPLAETGADFALLELPVTDLPAFALHRAGAPLTLTNVIAAGYPGDVLEVDGGFAALQAGDAGAVPALTLTDGIVNTEQRMGEGTDLLMHSAPLSSGNSGGPLVDMCGRVVGVNSFVRKGPMQNRGFALAVSDLLAFLEGTQADPVITPDACAPVVRPYGASVEPG